MSGDQLIPMAMASPTARTYAPAAPKSLLATRVPTTTATAAETIDEDKDDDNDGIPDFEKDGATQKDQCPKGSVFNSNISTDYDGDGCKDDDPDGEDDDDDNDNVNDFEADGITQKDLWPQRQFIHQQQ